MTDKVAYEETHRARAFRLQRKLDERDETIAQLLAKIEALELDLRTERCMEQSRARRNASNGMPS